MTHAKLHGLQFLKIQMAWSRRSCALI